MSNKLITALVGFVLFFATLLSVWLLKLAGRKSLMVYCNAAMTIDLCLLGFFYRDLSNQLMIFVVLSFAVLFSVSSGPITWLYMSEIMFDKALSIATVLVWTFALIISLTTLPLYQMFEEQENEGMIFLLYGIFTFIGTIFIALFMKETKGKTLIEIE